MYSRDFGTPPAGSSPAPSPALAHDYESRREALLQDFTPQETPKEKAPPEHLATGGPSGGAGLLDGVFGKFKNRLSSLELDDLLWIAVGVLLLLDGDSSNDMLLLFLVFLFLL